MPFIEFPIIWGEEDSDTRENLGLAPEREEGTTNINLKHLVSFNELPNGNVLFRMSDGYTYEIPMDIEDVKDLISTVESYVTLSDIHEN